MKKLSLLVLFAAVMAVGAQAQPIGSSVDQAVNVGVAIGNALSVEKNTDLFFGTFADATGAAGDLITINAGTGASSVDGGNAVLDTAPTDHSRAELDIVGADDAVIYVTFAGADFDEPTGVLTLTRDGGAQTQTVALTLSDGTTEYSGDELSDNSAEYSLDASGELTLGIGGTLEIVDEDGGFYRGTLTVTVSYF